YQLGNVKEAHRVSHCDEYERETRYKTDDRCDVHGTSCQRLRGLVAWREYDTQIAIAAQAKAPVASKRWGLWFVFGDDKKVLLGRRP
ncbi:hypothetical protein MK163_10345, partial [bacterium]|nr:hypothetical protein [bacterium]